MAIEKWELHLKCGEWQGWRRVESLPEVTQVFWGEAGFVSGLGSLRNPHFQPQRCGSVPDIGTGALKITCFWPFLEKYIHGRQQWLF